MKSILIGLPVVVTCVGLMIVIAKYEIAGKVFLGIVFFIFVLVLSWLVGELIKSFTWKDD